MNKAIFVKLVLLMVFAYSGYSFAGAGNSSDITNALAIGKVAVGKDFKCTAPAQDANWSRNKVNLSTLIQSSNKIINKKNPSIKITFNNESEWKQFDEQYEKLKKKGDVLKFHGLVITVKFLGKKVITGKLDRSNVDYKFNNIDITACEGCGTKSGPVFLKEYPLTADDGPGGGGTITN